MMWVGRRAIANNFSKNFRTALLSVFEAFQTQHCRAFAKAKSIALGVEGPALRCGQCLQRIESREDQVTQRIVSARKRTFRLGRSHQLERVSDGVRAGSACV